jgi:hypothetical protein
MGRQVSGPRLTEAEHFRLCPLCGCYVDMRDRVWLEQHRSALPHPAMDRTQGTKDIVRLRPPGAPERHRE